MRFLYHLIIVDRQDCVFRHRSHVSFLRAVPETVSHPFCFIYSANSVPGGPLVLPRGQVVENAPFRFSVDFSHEKFGKILPKIGSTSARKAVGRKGMYRVRCVKQPYHPGDRLSTTKTGGVCDEKKRGVKTKPEGFSDFNGSKRIMLMTP